MQQKIRIAPSMASAPMKNLERVVHDLEKAHVDFIHFDVEDGAFVPVMTLGIKIIKDLRYLTNIPFDVHLMTINPERIVPLIVQAGANRISVHYEACAYPRRVLRRIVEYGVKAGLAFNPKTPIPDLRYLSPYLSFVVVLSTEPEGSNDPFLEDVLEKIRRGKENSGLPALEWVADGGVSVKNINKVVRAGADTVVVGRSVFENHQIVENIQKIRLMASKGI